MIAILALVVRAIRFAARGVNVSVDQSRADRRHANALARYFIAEPDGEGIDRTLGSRIVDIGIGRAEFRRDRRKVDDDAALAAMLGRHALDGLARA